MADLAPRSSTAAAAADPGATRRRLAPPSAARQSLDSDGTYHQAASANGSEAADSLLGGQLPPADQPAPVVPIRACGAEYGALQHVSGGGARHLTIRDRPFTRCPMVNMITTQHMINLNCKHSG